MSPSSESGFVSGGGSRTTTTTSGGPFAVSIRHHKGFSNFLVSTRSLAALFLFASIGVFGTTIHMTHMFLGVRRYRNHAGQLSRLVGEYKADQAELEKRLLTLSGGDSRSSTPTTPVTPILSPPK